MVRKNTATRFRKSYRRRRNGVLRKRKIFSRKSATSQARQIYALNKKVNRMYRSIKPEIQTFDTVSYGNLTKLWEPAESGNTYRGYYQQIPLFYYLKQTDRWNFEGNLCRCKNVKLTFTLAPGAGAIGAADLIYRITILRTRGPLDLNSLPPIQSTFSTNSGVVSIKYLVNGPLNDNITAQGKIVRDIKGRLSKNQNRLTVKRSVILPGFTMRRPNTDDGSNFSSIMRGEYVIGVSFGWTSLSIDQDASEVSSAFKIQKEMDVKIAYIDDNVQDLERNRRHNNPNLVPIDDTEMK